MARAKNKDTSRIINPDVLGIILSMAIRHGSRSSLGVYVGGSRGLLTAWENGYSFPSPAAQAALISLSNGELEPEDFVGLPIHPRPGESMGEFIRRKIFYNKAATLGLSVDEYIDSYVTYKIKDIIDNEWLEKKDIAILTTVVFNDRSFWLKVYRRFIRKQRIYDKNNRKFIESQELADDVPNDSYTAEL